VLESAVVYPQQVAAVLEGLGRLTLPLVFIMTCWVGSWDTNCKHASCLKAVRSHDSAKCHDIPKRPGIMPLFVGGIACLHTGLGAPEDTRLLAHCSNLLSADRLFFSAS
jgi:hypothetical protein